MFNGTGAANGNSSADCSPQDPQIALPLPGNYPHHPQPPSPRSINASFIPTWQVCWKGEAKREEETWIGSNGAFKKKNTLDLKSFLYSPNGTSSFHLLFSPAPFIRIALETGTETQYSSLLPSPCMQVSRSPGEENVLIKIAATDG